MQELQHVPLARQDITAHLEDLINVLPERQIQIQVKHHQMLVRNALPEHMLKAQETALAPHVRQDITVRNPKWMSHTNVK